MPGSPTASCAAGSRRGDLDKIGMRTYRSPSMPASALADLVAVMLDIGEPCWASGPTAAALLGFDGFKLTRPFHITVLRGRHIERTRREGPHHPRPPADRPGHGRRHPRRRAAPGLHRARPSRDPERLTVALDSGFATGCSARTYCIGASWRCGRRAATASPSCSTSSPAPRSPAVATAGWSGSS